jgi:hypothetical protein
MSTAWVICASFMKAPLASAGTPQVGSEPEALIGETPFMLLLPFIVDGLAVSFGISLRTLVLPYVDVAEVAAPEVSRDPSDPPVVSGVAVGTRVSALAPVGRFTS